MPYDRCRSTVGAFLDVCYGTRGIHSCYCDDLTDAVARRVRCTLGDVSFTVKSGNIVEQDCDAIVNSTDEKLDLSRGLFAHFYVSCCLTSSNARRGTVMNLHNRVLFFMPTYLSMQRLQPVCQKS